VRVVDTVAASFSRSALTVQSNVAMPLVGVFAWRQFWVWPRCYSTCRKQC